MKPDDRLDLLSGIHEIQISLIFFNIVIFTLTIPDF
ncbi:hypothetical protein Mucpa_4895 [Mucilaginibacter paludis DSM 18603]|uniref:Uncharacterized protein n=1 Tax=Mucilaginibacter paludis DSM 18603 TaxID=714943 RepID=H1Y792_9SPHI|nr:hypothetical protein Mucpa_4895 [Mucilaginibacter paludis DSM 18603]